MARRRMVSDQNVQFTGVDQVVVGTYKFMEEIPYQGDKLLKKYTFDNEIGTFVIMGTMQIDKAMERVKPEEVVEITYKGTVPTSSGWQVKLFEIAVLEEGGDDGEE